MHYQLHRSTSLSSLLQERLIRLTVQSKVDHPFTKMDFINIGDSPIWVKDDRVVDFNPDVTQTRINLEVRDKFLRRRASLRVAASRLYRRDPRVVTVCAEGVLKHWAGLALLLILWLYRIRSKSSKVRVKVCVTREAFEVCAPQQSTIGGEKVAVVSSSGPSSLREKTDSHLKTVIRQRLLKSGDVELNPGPYDGTNLWVLQCV